MGPLLVLHGAKFKTELVKWNLASGDAGNPYQVALDYRIRRIMLQVGRNPYMVVA